MKILAQFAFDRFQEAYSLSDSGYVYVPMIPPGRVREPIFEPIFGGFVMCEGEKALHTVGARLNASLCFPSA